MRGHSILSILLVLLSAACVDRVFIDVGRGAAFSIVIDGHISDQPGPYRVEINSGHDSPDAGRIGLIDALINFRKHFTDPVVIG